MADRYLLESGAPDGYQLEDGLGVLLLEGGSPTRGLISWTELETPLVATRGQISWTEIEVPLAPTRGLVSWTEIEAPLAPTRGLISWSEGEFPTVATRGLISFAEFEFPDVGTVIIREQTWVPPAGFVTYPGRISYGHRF